MPAKSQSRPKPSSAEPASGWNSRIQGFTANPQAPTILLGVVAALSLLLRMAWLSNPRVLLFDENYYVNAARKILSLSVPADQIYANGVPGMDPNPSHPPLGKVLISMGIRAFGDNPFGWRIVSLLFGTAAILALYWLARSSGIRPWVSLGASTLMAADPMFFIHGRMGTLEIMTATFMMLAVAVYLNGRPGLAGLLLGFGACIKLTAFFALVIFGVLELFRMVRAKAPETDGPDRPRRPRVLRKMGTLALVSSVSLISYLAVLTVLDSRFTRFDNPIIHTASMIKAFSGIGLDESITQSIGPAGPVMELSAAAVVPVAAASPVKGPAEPGGATGTRDGPVPLMRQKGQDLYLAPSSAPWDWLLNKEKIVYYRAPNYSGPQRSLFTLGKESPDAAVFVGVISPAIIFLAVPALGYVAVRAWRRRDADGYLPVAWFLGIFGLYLAVFIWRPGTTGHLYYMLIVMPAIYIALAQMFAAEKMRRFLPLFGFAVALGFLYYYPFKTWGGV